MLILTRKVGETLTIGDNIQVTVLEVRGKQVRLGIGAPAEVVVLRDELFQRLAQENQQAAGFLYPDLEALVRSMGREMPANWGLKENPPHPAAITFATKYFGRIKVTEDHIITFSSGLVGYAEFHRYALLEEPRTAPFSFLQCVEEPELCFVVAEPARVIPDFRLGPVSHALKELAAASIQDLKVMVILTLPSGRPQELTANLLCPVLINPKLGRGKQAIMEGPQYTYKSRVIPIPSED